MTARRSSTLPPSRDARTSGAPGALHALGPYAIPGLDGDHLVRVYTPSGHSLARPQPVLVLFDGQNVFDDAPSYAGGWHAHVSVDALSPRTMWRPLVVGVNHGGTKRIDELGPFSAGGRGGGGRTDALIAWIGEKLLPEVRARFGGWEGPVGTAIGGSSMGGLAALYAHFRRPDLFGGVVSMSPSLWFGGRALFAFVERTSRPLVSRIYLDCGAREGGGRMAGAVEQMGNHLRFRGWNDDALLVRIDPRGTHAERHWRRRLPAALRFMYRRAS